jgi:hypothetical protein
LLIELLVQLFSEKELGDPVAVPQIGECDTSEFPYALYPSGQCNLLALLCDAQFATGMSSVHFYVYFL